MGKTKSEWTDKQMSRYVDLVRQGMHPIDARKAVELSRKAKTLCLDCLQKHSGIHICKKKV